MSCIALSVGLGNVWRFPFAALENGGGAFLIPYVIVLLLVGKPIYYLEMVVGQFSSRGSINVYDIAPAMKGKIEFYFKFTVFLFFIICLTFIYRNWIWSSIFGGCTSRILCINISFNNTLFYCIISILFTMEYV